MTLKPDQTYGAATRMVHDGVTRSAYGEVSEPIYLTQGFAYPSAEQAEKRFNGEDPGFVYSRYANPTNDIFEKKNIGAGGGRRCPRGCVRHGRRQQRHPLCGAGG